MTEFLTEVNYYPPAIDPISGLPIAYATLVNAEENLGVERISSGVLLDFPSSVHDDARSRSRSRSRSAVDPSTSEEEEEEAAALAIAAVAAAAAAEKENEARSVPVVVPIMPLPTRRISSCARLPAEWGAVGTPGYMCTDFIRRSQVRVIFFSIYHMTEYFTY